MHGDVGRLMRGRTSVIAMLDSGLPANRKLEWLYGQPPPAELLLIVACAV